MSDTQNGQTAATAPTTGGAGAVPDNAAAGLPSAGSTVAPGAAAPKSYKLKVNGQDMDVPETDIVTLAQKGLAATKTWEESKAMRDEAARLKAEAAAQGDPMKALLESLNKQVQPQPAPDPFAAIAQDENIFAPEVRQMAGVSSQLYSEVQRLKAENESLKGKLPGLEKAVEETRQAILEEQVWDEARREFEVIAAADADFTARVTRDPATGKRTVDYGSNDDWTMTALRIKNSDQPDPRIGGRVGKNVPLSEIFKAVKQTAIQRVRESEQRTAAQRDAERKNAATVITATGEIPAPPAEMTPLPTDDKATRERKAELMLQYYQERARDAGLHVTG